MIRPRALAAALLAGALVLAGCTGKDAVDQGAGGKFRYIGTTQHGKTIAVANRKRVSGVTGKLIDGGAFNLAAATGQVVVLNFWASWCAPCRSESPGLDSVYRALKAKGVTVVGLDVKDPNRDSATSFIRDNDITYPIVYDPNARTALQLGKVPLSIGLPWTVVVDKQQRVAAVYNGQILPADLQPVLMSLLAES
jgi:thiol-disulfide isomerase/thioredoxin